VKFGRKPKLNHFQRQQALLRLAHGGRPFAGCRPSWGNRHEKGVWVPLSHLGALNLSRCRATKWLIASWTAFPPTPRGPICENLAASPRRCQANPVGTPAGFLVFRSLPPWCSALCRPQFRGGDRGSAASLPSPSPFACPGLPCTSSALWLRRL
jgi:hypothetical protein